MPTKPPLKMILDLTNKCNLSCYMCNVHYKKGIVDEFATMSDEVFERIMPFVSHLKKLTLGGNGEPFVDNKIFTRLSRIREINKAIFIDTFSNASLLKTKDIVSNAVNLINKFMFSINGFTKDVYESIMIGSDFNKLQRNLTLFKEVREKSTRKISTTAECIVMRRNISTIVEGVKFCNDLGVDALILKPMWIIDEVTGAEFVRPEEIETVRHIREQIRSAQQAGKECNVRVELYDEIRELYFRDENREADSKREREYPRPAHSKKESVLDKISGCFKFCLNDKSYLQPSNRSLRILPCTDPWENIQVFEHGVVFLCCQGVTPIGDLNISSIAEVWNSEEAVLYRKGMTTGEYYGGCKTCNRVAPSDVGSYVKPFHKDK